MIAVGAAHMQMTASSRLNATPMLRTYTESLVGQSRPSLFVAADSALSPRAD